MSEYVSRLLLRRICMSRGVRIRVERHSDPKEARAIWIVRAFDDARHRTWAIRSDDLDSAARALARRVGLVLPSNQLSAAREAETHCGDAVPRKRESSGGGLPLRFAWSR